MRLTSKSQYGLLVLAELVRSYRTAPRGYTQISLLSERCGTSAKYLEQILLPLTHSGILDSKRGANGGYRLSRPPSQVTLADVIRFLDGRLMPIPEWADNETGVSSSAPNDRTNSRFGEVLRQVRDAIRGILENTNIDVLVDDAESVPDSSTLARSRGEVEELMFYI